MARQRRQIDLGGPLLREQEGCDLTGRSLSGRLAEVVDRLTLITRAAAPDLSDEAWSFICWAGWDVIQSARLLNDPRDVDGIAWLDIVTAAAERDSDLGKRLRTMSPVERVAVLERVEAYGRTQAMERG